MAFLISFRAMGLLTLRCRAGARACRGAVSCSVEAGAPWPPPRTPAQPPGPGLHAPSCTPCRCRRARSVRRRSRTCGAATPVPPDRDVFPPGGRGEARNEAEARLLCGRGRGWVGGDGVAHQLAFQALFVVVPQLPHGKCGTGHAEDKEWDRKRCDVPRPGVRGLDSGGAGRQPVRGIHAAPPVPCGPRGADRSSSASRPSIGAASWLRRWRGEARSVGGRWSGLRRSGAAQPFRAADQAGVHIQRAATGPARRRWGGGLEGGPPSLPP